MDSLYRAEASAVFNRGGTRTTLVEDLWVPLLGAVPTKVDGFGRLGRAIGWEKQDPEQVRR